MVELNVEEEIERKRRKEKGNLEELKETEGVGSAVEKNLKISAPWWRS